MIVIAIIAVIAAIAIPGLLQSQRASNERNASSSLKTMASAEADFCNNDRDGNRFKDYWTMNVIGLYALSSLTTLGTADGALKLLDVSIASADTGEPTQVTPAPFAAESIALGFPPSPKAGYWYMALISDQSDPAGPADYRTDTDGSGAEVHNVWKFGFLAYSDSLSAGRTAFIINENNTVFKRSLPANIRAGGSVMPPGAVPTDATFLDWPTDADLGALWAKLD